MKKILSLLLAAMFLTAPLAIAQEGDLLPETQEQGMEGKEREGKGDKGEWKHKKKWGKMKGMCTMMSDKKMVAVGDGVVVLVGKKLIKYDKNLNVVKEVEIKADCGCPMCKGHGKDKDGAAEEGSGEAEQAAHH